MIFKGCAGCLFGNLCRTERGVCAHYCQLMNDDEEEKIAEVQAIYDRLNIKAVVEQVMLDYDRKAFAALDAVGLPDEKKAHLRTYAELLSGRKK